MNSTEERQRKVILCTNTKDSDAIRELSDALVVDRGCAVVVTNTEELVEHCSKGEGVDAVLLDDVNPSECPDAKMLVKMLLRIRPPLRSIVILVGGKDWDDVSGAVADIDGGPGRVSIHCHNDPLERFFDSLAGKLRIGEKGE